MAAGMQSNPSSQPMGPAALAPQSVKSSLLFVKTALDTISISKDARKRPQLADATKQAIDAIAAVGDASQIDPEVLFKPLEMAASSTTVSVVTTAIDCIGKLISYSYFSIPSTSSLDENPNQPALIDRSIDTICNTFQEDETPPEIELQIVKSLLAAVLNDKIVVHGAGLLKAVRLVYNIFLTSQSHTNQQISQGALTQIVGVVFERVDSRLITREHLAKPQPTTQNPHLPATDSNDATVVSLTGPDGDTEIESVHEDTDNVSVATESNTPREASVDQHETAPITLQSFENRKSFDDAHINDNAPTLVTPNVQQINGVNAVDTVDGLTSEIEDEVYIKDAYLIFRAMCRLSIKPVPVEQAHDVKSDGIRSKLLSLHIVHNILLQHISVVTSPFAVIRNDTNDRPTSFVQAIKPYLCLSLSRNGASSVSRVFEVSCDLFWLMVKHLRVALKREIEVFMKEIYISILDKRPIPPFQEYYILKLFSKIASDSRLLVEMYLNYDCDRTALDNMYQRIVESLSRITSSPIQVTAVQEHAYNVSRQKTHDEPNARLALIPSLSTVSMSGPEADTRHLAPYWLREDALLSLVQILRSLLAWGQEGSNTRPQNTVSEPQLVINTHSRQSLDARGSAGSPSVSHLDLQEPDDDPGYVEEEKRRKNELTASIRLFNLKPKRGVDALLEKGFIPSRTPDEIARFLFENSDQIDKATLGHFLGEGDVDSIAIMHSFVDLLDFRQTRFVDALRRFLQAFRLPGEAQKIDRLMLKFAERYIAGNTKAFANADTAYVLAYSAIILNTDQHSPNMQGPRMTVGEFISNNRGINDDANLPDEYLTSVFEDISQNEIVLIGEREAAVVNPSQSKGIAATIGESLIGRYNQREHHYQVAEAMTNRTELVYKRLMRAERRNSTRTMSRFIPARSHKHVGPMFQVTWMPIFTAFASYAQVSTSNDQFAACMEGLKLGTRIACLFDLADPRQAFVSSLVKFTNLYNLSEMKQMNVEALKAVLEVAITEGNHLKESWRDILTCISQLDRFQLISTGVDEGQIPDVLKTPNPNSKVASNTRRSLQIPTRSRQRSQSGILSLPPGIAEESTSTNTVLAVDRIFTNTANLSGEAIVHFVRALCQVSLREIESSGQMESPRTFSLQKVIEVSGYNMTRVRFEWTNIWQELGAHFTEVGHNSSTSVVNFALDSLRQLSMRFMELGELPGFKFQKDFLRPFEDIMKNSKLSQVSEVSVVQDMVLLCLMQILQAQGDNMRSGWRTMFAVLTYAAHQSSESLVTLAFQSIVDIYNNRFEAVLSQGSFRDLTTCLSVFAKNPHFHKKALQAIEMLNTSVPKMLRASECSLVYPGVKKNAPKIAGVTVQLTGQHPEEQFWFPALFAFHNILMTGEDLEIRTMALTYLFQTLTNYGSEFSPSFWDKLWHQLLYPIFMVIRSSSEMSQASHDEELSVWLSTTPVQALRSMVQLFTHFFDPLESMLNRFLDLLALCICQDNDTLARIGSNCLQQLIGGNVSKFTDQHWRQIVDSFIVLFEKTEATQLFSAAPAIANESDKEQDDSFVGQDLEDYRPENNITPVAVVTSARRQFFNQIITKCVLQLLMIETVHSLFTDDEVYKYTPSEELLRLMEVLKQSYHFARKFNQDRALRARLFRDGFMKQPPNLLKQESGSANVYISILFRMYRDQHAPQLDGDSGMSEEVVAALSSSNELGLSSLSLSAPSADKSREVNEASPILGISTTPTSNLSAHDAIEKALVPLSVEIIQSFTQLDEETQQRNVAIWRPVVIDVLVGFTSFAESDFKRHMPTFASLLVGLMGRYMMGADLQSAVQALLMRMFELQSLIDPAEWKKNKGSGGNSGAQVQTPVSQQGGGFGHVRTPSQP